MIRRLLITVLICITCIESVCLSDDVANSVYYQKIDDPKKIAAVLRDKLFAGEKYIEYECFYEFGESPFYVKIQEAYSGEFILYMKYLKEPKNISVNKYLLKYDGKKFSSNNKDPFFHFSPQEICNMLCLPAAYLLNNMTEKNGVIIKFIENKKTISYGFGVFAGEAIFTFIQGDDKMEYYGGYFKTMADILPISFTRKNISDEKEFLNSADKFTFTKDKKDKYEKEWEQRMSMMDIWLESIKNQKQVLEK